MKIIFTLIFVMAGLVAQGQTFAGGVGTSEDPYQVATPHQLDLVRQHLDRHFIQTGPIDLGPYISTTYSADGWLPIGVNLEAQRFMGTYDGKGYKISGLTINRPGTDNVGLFGCIGFGAEGPSAVVIRNVHLDLVGAVTGGSATGALVGRVNGDSKVLIEGCSVTGIGKVSGTRVTGGMVGANNSFRQTEGGTDNPTIRQCYANIPVEGRGTLAISEGGGPGSKEKIGGLVGCNQKGNTIDSYAHGSVTIVDAAAERVGGLAGCTDLRGLIERGYAKGLVTPFTGSINVGGLVGALSGRGGNVGVVNESYWDTQTSGQTASAGGTGKLTADMQTQSTFVGWDFDAIWSISANTYPALHEIIGIVGSGVTDWTGVTSNNWNDASNWSAGVPAPSAAVSIPGSTTHDPLLSGSATMTGLTIASGATLAIGPMGSLRVSGTLTNNAGISGLTIQSDATGTGSLISESAVNASIQRYISGSTNLQAMQYHMVSVPLTQTASLTSNLFLGAYLYRFNTPTQAWAAMGSATTTILDVDQGYMIYYPEASKTYTFSGQLNSGDFVIPVSFHEAAGYSGFNLVPNPYPSVIDWNATKINAGDPDPWTKTNLDDAIWIWDPANGNYAAYGSEAGTNGATSFIPVGQSFFVRAKIASPALTVRNGARVHDDQPFFKKEKGQTEELLRIRALANNYSDEIVVRFLEEATPQHDSRFDAVKMYGLAEAPQLYSQAADGQKLSIYSHPHPTENISIPLGFELEEGETAQLKFEGMDSFDAEMQLLLEDLLEDVVIDLRTESAYSFAHEPGFDTDRFVLHMQVNSTTGTDPLPEETPFGIFAANRHIHLSVPSLAGQTAVVEVFDLLGRRQQYHQVELGAEVVLGTGSFDGVAIVRVVAGQQVFTQRVIIK